MSQDRAVPVEPVVNLGARLKVVRQRSGLSLREVARRLGVSPSFLSQLENGKSQPSGDHPVLEVFTLRAGEAPGFDSATPHLLSNRTDHVARGIWFVQHPRG